MSKGDYAAFHALDPFFAVVMEGLSKFVEGEHYFDALADDVLFEFLYNFPGWPQVTRGRADLMSLYSGYGNNIRLDRGDSLAVHPSENGRVVPSNTQCMGGCSPRACPTTTGLSQSLLLRTIKSYVGEITWILSLPGQR
jgi:hypothetical protein